MKRTAMFVAAALLLCALFGSASAKVVSVEGVITFENTVSVKVSFGGTVTEVFAEPGDRVEAGQAVAELAPVRVYAPADGTAHVFAAVGDRSELAAARWGAAVLIETNNLYVAANGQNAYDSAENRRVHPGEKVYLRGVTNQTHTGAGTVGAAAGGAFTVVAEEGGIEIGESVNIYRTPGFENTARIGRGTLAAADPVAVGGNGVIVRMAVKEGDSVRAGDLLFETMQGSAAAELENAAIAAAPCAGILYSVKATGSILAQEDVCAELIPDGALRVKAPVPESDLESMQPGVPVQIEFLYREEAEARQGTVEKVSMLPDGEKDGEALYAVTIAFEGEDVRPGMHVLVTVLPQMPAANEAAEAAAEE